MLNDDPDKLVIVTPGGNVRPFDMMLSRALHLAGDYPSDPAEVEAWKGRLSEATDQVLKEVDNDDKG